MRACVFAAVLVALALQASSAPPRVSFIRPPRLVSESNVIPFKVRIPRNDDNRALELVAFDNGGAVSQTHRDLDGESQPLWDLNVRLPAGDLEVAAVLFGGNGTEVARATAPVCVRGSLDEICPSLSGDK